MQQFQRACPHCNGQGKKLHSTCHVCRGDKQVRTLDELTVFVERGIPDGHEYVRIKSFIPCVQKFREAADEYVNVRAGEVIIKVQTIPHKIFERDRDDLKTTAIITLKQALLGFEKELTHLDGRKVKLNRKGKITKPGEVEKIRGEGMPVYEASS